MNDMPLVWVIPNDRMYAVHSRRKRSGIMLAVALLCALAAAEVLFLNNGAGPDSVAMMMAAEGDATSE
jgi:hypothetical protein